MKGMHSPIVFVMPFYSFFKSEHEQNYKKVVYASGEIALELSEDVANRQVCIYAGGGQQQDLFELFLLIDTVKKHNPQDIVIILPFLWYARFDGSKYLHSSCLLFFINSLIFYGVSKIITFDIHNKEYINFLLQQKVSPLLIKEVLHEKVWEDLVIEYKSKGFSIAFPDEGAMKRYESYTKDNVDFIFFKKQRKEDNVFITNYQGKASKKILLIDDILYSGATLLEACKALKQLGAVEIIIIVSHGFFIGNKWKDLFDCGVQLIHVSNSLSHLETIKHPFIKVHNISSFL